MKIEIGNKQLSNLTSENLRQIIMIIGACPSFEFWDEPEILDFSNTTFSDTITIDYQSKRKSDRKESMTYIFFFNFKKLRWHYTKDFDRLDQKAPHHNRECNFQIIKYLISEGFDVPIY